MALAFGSLTASKIYLGATEVALAYFGATQVYSNGPAASYLLDTYTGAAAAYSLRDLTSSWTSSDVVLVRRSSDAAESGFTATEVSDGTMLAWVGTGGTDNGFVTTWYDQSGNANNVVQATTTAQPKIVDAGVAVSDNGKAATLFTGGQYLNSGAVSAIGTATNFAVAQITGGASIRTLFYTPEVFNLYSADWRFLALSSQIVYAGAVEAQLLHYFGANSTQGFGAINGGTTTTNAQGAGSGSKIAIGTQSTNAIPFYGYIQECVYYASDETANRTGIESNINYAYSIYGEAVYSAEATNYFSRLAAAGDPTFYAYRQPLANYIDSLVTLGGAYWDTMLSATSFVGVGIQGITVPLRDGMTVPTNNNFVAGDLNQLTGLKGDATTKYIASNVAGNALSQNDVSASVYQTVLKTAGGGFILANNGPSVGLRTTGSQWMNGSIALGGTSTIGLYGAARSTSTDIDVRNNQTDYSGPSTSTTPSTDTIGIFAIGVAPSANSRLATYHVGPALNLATLEGLQDTLITEIAAI